MTGPDDLVERARRHLADDQTLIAALRAAARLAETLSARTDPEVRKIGGELSDIVMPALAALRGEVRP